MTNRAIIAMILACLVVVPFSCRRGGDTRPPIIESDEGRFPHSKHRGTQCTECHALSDVLAGRPAVPGKNDHAPCDREQCHQADFLREPGPFCTLCHDKVDATRAGGTEPALYPPRAGHRALAATFSHASHLDFGLMEQHVGFHVACVDCHAVGDDGLAQPNHAVCGRCHAPEAAAKGTPAMSRCSECHIERTRRPSRLRRLIVGDLGFAHRQHRIDRRGKLVLCAECHTDSATVKDIGSHTPPAIAACVSCHDDQARVPREKRMRVCETCHTTMQSSLGALSPPNHLPASERPIDHTLAFQRDHTAEAERDAQRCAKCHTFMSGNKRDVCDQCHRVMSPADHVVTWREFDHGPEAATSSDRCSRCHEGEFCTSCHSQIPRSHRPLMFFREGGHGDLARINMRACMTCHQQSLCVSCHGNPPQ